MLENTSDMLEFNNQKIADMLLPNTILMRRHILKNLWKAITTRNETEIDWTDLVKTHPTLHVVGLNHFSQKKLCTVDMKEQT
jgi:hypothetical protein